MRVHVIQTGRNIGNETLMREARWSSLFRRRKPYEFPVFSFVIEHQEGLIAIDTGSSTRVRVSRMQHRLMGVPPLPVIEPGEEIDSQLAAQGLRTEDVRRVVLTHLDWDHAGGIEHFPDAEILVHRPGYEYATSKPMGKLRYQTKLWPEWFDPTLYDLDSEPYGPFPASKSLTEDGDVRLVPIPGHTVGQVGVIVQADGHVLFFAAMSCAKTGSSRTTRPAICSGLRSSQSSRPKRAAGSVASPKRCRPSSCRPTTTRPPLVSRRGRR